MGAAFPWWFSWFWWLSQISEKRSASEGGPYRNPPLGRVLARNLEQEVTGIRNSGHWSRIDGGHPGGRPEHRNGCGGGERAASASGTVSRCLRSHRRAVDEVSFQKLVIT